MDQQKNNRQVANWLLAGVVMIMIQVMLGGITRLTESGLSITEWKPITGALPPMNESAWQVEFEKYRNTDQFKFVHQDFSLSDFKYIFFWEWFHRLWARMMGLVFITGFLYFLIRRKFNSSMILPMVLLFLLGALQGAIGWIMVKSGLVPEKYFVGHVELTTHFIAALILLFYTLWFALSLLPAFNKKVRDNNLFGLLLILLFSVFIQLIFGGFMAGLKAASAASSWPFIHLPANFNDVVYVTHFFHRGIAYLLFGLVLRFFISSKKYSGIQLFNRYRRAFLMLIILQVIVGISTLMSAAGMHNLSGSNNLFILLGVSHQFIAMLVVACLCILLFLVRRTSRT